MQYLVNGLGVVKGIAPLDRESNKNHKILKFPILRASVKAYQNNLNTHKSYSKI
jgi:Bax protein